ncbi:MAG: hypothetical protein K2W95_11460 [Candidatus Obscuribacterales bacterium]|nr:hypothetical protein [Candidatus Obscuribacterales bacterium]
MGTILIIPVILMALMFGSMAMDVSHVVSVRQELQSAVDAAAMAGAQSLSTDSQSVERHAREVCRLNYADGTSVDDASTPMDVSVTVVPSTVTTPGTVRVTAEVTSSNILAKLFNHHTTKVRASALAGGTGPLAQMNGTTLFPLAVSLDDSKKSLNFRPLNELHVGDTFELVINSQQYKNAAFTSFSDPNTNANWIKAAIAQSLGIPTSTSVTIPPVKVGDQISLANGVLGQKALASDPYYSALAQQEVIYLAVVEGSVPFNQTRPLVGFIGVKVNSITTNKSGGIVEQISVTLKKPLSTGIEGAVTGSTALNTTALNEMAPVSCKLLD